MTQIMTVATNVTTVRSCGSTHNNTGTHWHQHNENPSDIVKPRTHNQRGNYIPGEDIGSFKSTSSSTTTTTKYENNPYKIVPVHIDSSSSSCHEQIERIVGVLCPFLASPSSKFSIDNTSAKGTLSIRPLTGGLSNHLFLVSRQNNDDNGHHYESSPSTVLVRIHPDSASDGDDDEAIDDDDDSSASASFSIVNRELENRFAAWLAKQRQVGSHLGHEGEEKEDASANNKLAPTVYGRFENGRVEEYYDGVRPLSCSEMKVYAPLIAPQLASFHQLSDPSSSILPRPTRETATIYETMEAWLQEAKYLLRNESSNTKGRVLLDRLCNEWQWLKAQLAQPPRQSPDDKSDLVSQAVDFIRRVAVTHMDCQPLNILVNENETPTTITEHKINLRLIDFEYSGWNPVAADIANTFCEYCEMSNLRANYEVEYPSEAQQDDFFWHYCQAYPIDDPEFSFLSQARDSKEWSIVSIAMQHEVGRFSMLSHLGWAVWSVIKSKEEDGVDFDYIFYANHRMEGYDWAKRKFFG